MVRTRPPAAATLVGSKRRSPGGFLLSKVLVLKRQGGGRCRVHLPLDTLSVVRTSSAVGSSGGAGSIPFQNSQENISWTSGGLRFRSSGEASRLVAEGD